MNSSNGSSDEQRIRELDTQWSDAASGKHLDAVVSVYGTDATLVWPFQPAVHGTANIRSAWQDTFKLKDLKLTFAPERIEISKCGDLASDFGKVAFGYDDPKSGPVDIKGKYVVVWKKTDGVWKVLYDSWNTDDPAAPASAAPSQAPQTNR